MRKKQAVALRLTAIQSYESGKITQAELGGKLLNISQLYRQANGLPGGSKGRKQYATFEKIYPRISEYREMKKDGFTDFEIAEFFDASLPLFQKVKKAWREEGILT